MTRDEFMDVVYDELYSDGDNNRANRIIDAADSYVDEYAPHWIPVTERPPEKDGRYYVTLENKYVKILYYAVEQTIRHPKGFYYLTEDGRMAWSQTQNPVLAWMPLPEPYKGVTT